MGLNNGPDQEEIKLLINLAYNYLQEELLGEISEIDSYEKYNEMWGRLEMLRPMIDQIPNPTARDILEHIQRLK